MASPHPMTGPASHPPQCSDGVRGNGACLCFPDYKGIACHICSNPNKHGDQCQEGGWSQPVRPTRERRGCLERGLGTPPPQEGKWIPRRKGENQREGEDLRTKIDDVSFPHARMRAGV